MHQPQRHIAQAKDAPVAAVHAGWLVSLQRTRTQHMTAQTEAHMGHFERLKPKHCIMFDTITCVVFFFFFKNEIPSSATL